MMTRSSWGWTTTRATSWASRMRTQSTWSSRWSWTTAWELLEAEADED
jgi:hypothetical protein